MIYVLMLTLFGVDNYDFAYVIDHNMTGEECITKFEQQQPILEKTFDAEDFRLSCELDNAEQMP